jgi:glycosyltransferase involved in cell wall biosynthesis
VISVIIATFNSAATIGRTLDSLAAQRDAEFEVLLADGASRDGTMGIVGRHAEIVSLSISEPDKGVYDAWNKLIPRARGDWLMFLGSDDWLEQPDTLARLEAAAKEVGDPELSYVFGKTPLMEGGKPIEWMGMEALADNRLGLDDPTSFSHTGLLHHRSLFDQFGLFDASFRSAGDYEFMLRTARDERVRFHHVPMVVAHMASGGMSNNAKGRLLHYREMVAAREKLGLLNRPEWLAAALKRANLLAFLFTIGGRPLALAGANLYRRVKGKPTRSEIG